MINTTGSVRRTSTVLGDKCQYTRQNMKKLMAAAGAPEYRSVKTLIPRLPGSGDDVVFAGLNGVKFYFLRGESADVPEPVAEILRNTGVI